MPDRPRTLGAFLRASVGSNALGVILLLLAASGCSSPTVARRPDVIPVTVPHLERIDVSAYEGKQAAINRALAMRAEGFAKMVEQGSVWYGDGSSMEPVLEAGSWIVTKPHPFTELKPGMIVLYTTSSGRPVAHVLVRRTTSGWLAAGVNNRTVDREVVTPSNLAGVIAGVFTPAR
ncbi:MAG: S24/S26 family peptidase [Rariglobus sp.]